MPTPSFKCSIKSCTGEFVDQGSICSNCFCETHLKRHRCATRSIPTSSSVSLTPKITDFLIKEPQQNGELMMLRLYLFNEEVKCQCYQKRHLQNTTILDAVFIDGDREEDYKSEENEASDCLSRLTWTGREKR